jgi:hypothetical protein
MDSLNAETQRKNLSPGLPIHRDRLSPQERGLGGEDVSPRLCVEKICEIAVPLVANL